MHVHCTSMCKLRVRPRVHVCTGLRMNGHRYCIIFIHFSTASPSLSLLEALPTSSIDTVGVCTPKLYRKLQVKDLPKVRAGFEPTTIRSKGTASTNVPPRTTIDSTRLRMIIIGLPEFPIFLVTIFFRD